MSDCCETSVARVRLRPTRPEDLPFVLAAETDPANNEWLLAWDEAGHRASLGDADLAHRVAEDRAGRRVGFVILAGLRNPHGSVECRRVVVVDKGRGYGRAVMEAVQELVFDAYGAHRLWLDTQTRNARARHVYAATGFSEEGILRECWRQHDAWQSLVVMSILETEYRAREAASPARPRRG